MTAMQINLVSGRADAIRAVLEFLRDAGIWRVILFLVSMIAIVYLLSR